MNYEQPSGKEETPEEKATWEYIQNHTLDEMITEKKNAEDIDFIINNLSAIRERGYNDQNIALKLIEASKWESVTKNHTNAYFLEDEKF